MKEQDKTDLLYIKGFNEGYLIAKHLPELAGKLALLKIKDERGQGIVNGIQELEHVQAKEFYPTWLKGDRSNNQNRQPGKEKDRDR